jgi:hypothetical protein
MGMHGKQVTSMPRSIKLATNGGLIVAAGSSFLLSVALPRAERTGRFPQLPPRAKENPWLR